MPLFGLDWKSALAAGAIFGILHLNGGRKYSYAIWLVIFYIYKYVDIINHNNKSICLSHTEKVLMPKYFLVPSLKLILSNNFCIEATTLIPKKPFLFLQVTPKTLVVLLADRVTNLKYVILGHWFVLSSL